jgi:hypothetical protein
MKKVFLGMLAALVLSACSSEPDVMYIGLSEEDTQLFTAEVGLNPDIYFKDLSTAYKVVGNTPIFVYKMSNTAPDSYAEEDLLNNYLGEIKRLDDAYAAVGYDNMTYTKDYIDFKHDNLLQTPYQYAIFNDALFAGYIHDCGGGENIICTQSIGDNYRSMYSPHINFEQFMALIMPSYKESLAEFCEDESFLPIVLNSILGGAVNFYPWYFSGFSHTLSNGTHIRVVFYAEKK